MLPCMKNEVIHALPLAFSYHGAHFNDFRARAQDDGDHGLPWGYLYVFSGKDELMLILLPPDERYLLIRSNILHFYIGCGL